MTDKEKVEKFNEIQKWLWECARDGNMLQSTMTAAIIRQFNIESPNGDDPNNA